jgi:hypothetical protein
MNSRDLKSNNNVLLKKGHKTKKNNMKETLEPCEICGAEELIALEP